MRLIGERLFSAAAALLFLGFLVPSAASQSLEVEGLEMGDVDTSFRDQGIRFTTEYMDQSLSYGTVLVPDELRSSLTEVRTPGQPRSRQDGILVFQPPGQSGESLNLAYQYSGDVPVEELQGWMYGSEKGNSGQLRGERVDLNPENGSSSVLSTSLEDNGVTWDIDIRSHYEHLIIEYRLVENVTQSVNGTTNTTQQVIWETEDVYSGEETDVLPFKYCGTQVNEEVQSLSCSPDNQYEDSHEVTVLTAYPDNYSFDQFTSGDLDAIPVSEASKWYSEAEQQVLESNLSEDLLIPKDEISGYRFKAYNVTLPSDSTPELTSEIVTEREGSVAGLKMYVIGSIGGTTTYESSGGGSTTEVIYSEGFEDGSLDGWTVNELSVVSDRSFQSTYSVYSNNGLGSSTQAYDIISNGGKQLDTFSYYYQETSSSAGGGVRLVNSDGDFEIGVATANPQLQIDDNNGIEQVAYGSYDTWYRVEYDFDWTNNDVDITWENMGSGSVETFNNRPLKQGVDIEQVNVENYNFYEWRTGGYEMWHDGFEAVAEVENNPPTFGEINSDPVNWTVGESFDWNASVSDPDGNLASVRARMLREGNVVKGWTQANSLSGDYYGLNNFYTPEQEANYTLEIKAEDSQGAYNISSTTQEVVILNQPPQVDKPVVRPSSPVPAGAEVNVSVNASDPDSNLGSVNTSLLSPDGSVEVDNASMTNSTAEASEYYYSFKIPGEASSLGTWNATVYAEDTAEASDTNSTKFNVTDQDPPNWFNLKTNASGGEIFHTESLNISAEWRDNESGLNKAVLATNETGEWKNWTGGTKSWNSGEKEISTYIWKNESFNGTLAYRIWAKDTAGNWNVTDTQTVKVMGMLTESLSDSVALSDETSSYGDFFGNSSAAVSLSEALSSTATVTDYLETQFDITSTVSDTVSVIEELSTPFTISLTLDSQGYTEDKQNDTVAVTSSTQSQAKVSDTASTAFDITTDMEVLGVSASEFLNSTVGVGTEARSQTFVDHAVDSAVNVVDDTIATVTEHTRLSTNYTLAETVQTQANTSNQQSATIQVTETVSSYAEKFAEILTPINIEANTGSQANASTQISTDIGVSTGLNTAAFITETISTTVDVEEICWAGSPCYQDITGNQTQNQTQPSTGTGIIDGDGPLTIIKPVPIERSLPEWLQIYYQQNRNAIHGFALFLIAATGFLTIRKLLRFL
ncbi:hypothetical protein KY092_08270 [Natronomonas gomsonensis]|uniref:hypothetical protein n=1 Tax=Natronomonas gomsonensis TaxID=1046043 RepID=UPI0020CA7B27|nr:hypothetical protein [Natronomonas gomsonensis]MCY4730553.1 hypothetical protein [Natronomonas gomsonensis]